MCRRLFTARCDNTVVAYDNETVLSRRFEGAVRKTAVTVAIGAVLRNVDRTD